MKEKIQSFMKGRYGMDDLNKFLLKVYLFFLVINIFLNSTIILILELAIFLFVGIRMFSKNIYQRVKENRQYTDVYGKIRRLWKEAKRSFIRSKTHIYKKCPKCKTTLKLKMPKTTGIKHTTCPDCHTRFAFLCLHKRK